MQSKDFALRLVVALGNADLERRLEGVLQLLNDVRVFGTERFASAVAREARAAVENYRKEYPTTPVEDLQSQLTEALAFVRACGDCKAADELFDFVANNWDQLLDPSE